MVEFTIEILDVNEFPPMLMTDMHFLTVRENDPNVTAPAVLGTITCYDHDISASLTLTMNSISYVIGGERVIDESLATKTYIEGMFNLTESSDDAVASSQRKASLVLTDMIDYEQLFRPNESLVEVEFVCSDRLFSKKASALLRFADANDNRPEFTESFQNVIEITETTDFVTPLARLDARDADLSREFGNESLVFAIRNCTPDTYGFNVRFGLVYSDSLLDADTDRMIEERRREYERSAGVFRESVEIECRVEVADMFGDSRAALRSERELSIRFVNLNDNAPVIKLSASKENTIEVEEGVRTQGKILAQIEVFDRDGAGDLRCLFGNDLTTYEVSFKGNP